MTPAMDKAYTRFISILLAVFYLFSSPSPVEAKRKKVWIDELKACAEESLALTELQKQLETAQKRSRKTYRKAKRLYKNVEADKQNLAEMDGESRKEIDQHNELVEEINTKAEIQHKVVLKSKRAARKQNLISKNLKERKAAYVDRCENLRFKRNHLYKVCGKNGEYKETDYCKEHLVLK